MFNVLASLEDDNNESKVSTKSKKKPVKRTSHLVPNYAKEQGLTPSNAPQLVLSDIFGDASTSGTQAKQTAPAKPAAKSVSAPPTTTPAATATPAPTSNGLSLGHLMKSTKMMWAEESEETLNATLVIEAKNEAKREIERAKEREKKEEEKKRFAIDPSPDGDAWTTVAKREPAKYKPKPKPFYHNNNGNKKPKQAPDCFFSDECKRKAEPNGAFFRPYCVECWNSHTAPCSTADCSGTCYLKGHREVGKMHDKCEECRAAEKP